MFCTNCGAEIDDKAVVCVKCGVVVQSIEGVTTSSRNNEWLTTFFLCFILGWLGAHRFYTKNFGIAVTQLVLGIISCGFVSGIWALIDLILIVTNYYKKGDGERLVNK